MSDSSYRLRLLAPPIVALGIVVTFYASVFLFTLVLIGFVFAIALAAIRERQRRVRTGLWAVIASWAWVVLVLPTFGVMPILIAPRLHFRLPLGNALGIFTGFTLSALYDAVTGADTSGLVDHPFPPLTDLELYVLGAASIASCAVPVWYLISQREGASPGAPSNSRFQRSARKQAFTHHPVRSRAPAEPGVRRPRPLKRALDRRNLDCDGSSVGMTRNDLPGRWVGRLEQYTDARYGPDYRHRGKLGATDFPAGSVVRLAFPDGSTAMFRHAFVIVEPDWNEVAVFTEHCGYHLFPYVDLTIDRLGAEPTNKPAGQP